LDVFVVRLVFYKESGKCTISLSHRYHDAHEVNDRAKILMRNVVIAILAMLSKAQLPQKHWVEAEISSSSFQ